MLDLDKMAVPLEGNNPAGVNLEYDPLYLELETLATGTPASEMGGSIIEGREPDWKKLSKNCLELWKKTRDLRVASYLVAAQTTVEGLPAFVPAFKLLCFLVRDMWDTFYPHLDPDYDNDPIERLNILALLSPEPGAFSDSVMFIARFREIKLIPSLKYTLRDLLVSQGEIEVGAGKAVDLALLKAEVMNAPVETVQAQSALALEAKTHIETLCKEMNDRMQGVAILSMVSLSREVQKLITFYASVKTVDGGGAEETEAVPVDGSLPAAGALRTSVNLAGYRAASREEALLLLRKGAEYFQRQEPNSPIPLLVNRALRISEMNFLDLIAEIVPDALSRGRDIMGVRDGS
jgi:type VI secretion system ImpA family protein